MILQHLLQYVWDSQGQDRPKKGIAHKLASFSPSKHNSKKTDDFDFVWFALHGRGKKAKINHLLLSQKHVKRRISRRFKRRKRRFEQTSK
jgi:hypothetical protein